MLKMKRNANMLWADKRSRNWTRSKQHSTLKQPSHAQFKSSGTLEDPKIIPGPCYSMSSSTVFSTL
jgi:hypothetical protein